MSIFTGKQHKGAMREHRERKRAEAEARSEAFEAEVQRAYMEIALEQMLTIQTVPGHPGRAVVPPHWRDAAVERAKANRA